MNRTFKSILSVILCVPALSVGQTYTGDSLRQIAFPLGGIGTGCVSVGGRGDLCNWEIFGKPDKGSHLRFSFFAIWAQEKGKDPVAKVLERRFMPPYADNGGGLDQRALSGLPRLDEASFRGEFPFAWIDFKDHDLPVQVSLQAWNPFIPLNVDDSDLSLDA